MPEAPQIFQDVSTFTSLNLPTAGSTGNRVGCSEPFEDEHRTGIDWAAQLACMLLRAMEIYRHQSDTIQT